MAAKSTILNLHQQLVNKTLTVEELVSQTISASKEHDGSNFLIMDNFDQALVQAKQLDQQGIDETNPLYGIPYFAKDNFSTKGIQTTAGSRILEGFKPPYNATMINLLNDQSMIMMGKTNLDELAMGGTGLSSGYGKMFNPFNSKYLVGGSSSGSAYAVATNIIPFATGTDTGDSIRKPASYTGIYGFKPTYGAISRYGIIPYAPSLDHAGFLANSLEDIALLADATFKWDKRDFTSVEIPKNNFYENLNNFDKTKTFGYLNQIHNVLPDGLKAKYEELYELLRQDGYTVKAVDFRQDLLESLASTYMMISFSEAVSSLSNLDGINFGKRVEAENFEEIMKKTRTEKFGPVVKRRFIMGSLNLKKENQHIYLLKAKKVRRLLNEEIIKVFEEVDLLFLPPSPSTPPLVEKAFEIDQNASDYPEFLEDILTIGNFTGIPSITIPFVQQNGLPIGLGLNANGKEDLLLLQAVKAIEPFINKMDKELK